MAESKAREQTFLNVERHMTECSCTRPWKFRSCTLSRPCMISTLRSDTVGLMMWQNVCFSQHIFEIKTLWNSRKFAKNSKQIVSYFSFLSYCPIWSLFFLLFWVHVWVAFRPAVWKAVQSDEAVFFQFHGCVTQCAFYAHVNLNVKLTCILVSYIF